MTQLSGHTPFRPSAGGPQDAVSYIFMFFIICSCDFMYRIIRP